MKALTFQGKNHVSVENVPDPKIEHPRDAIVRITTTCICGSDLHLYDGFIPTVERGDVLGHEPMGEVIELGPEVTNLKIGDRVVIPFTISCGQCLYCKQQLYSCCDKSNRNYEIAEKAYGYSPAGLFGYTHMLGGYQGGQAQYLRVPYADVGPIAIPEELPDEKVVFLSDIFPTGYMAAENCNIQPGDTIAIWGAGPVGQMALRSAFLMGAGRVIVIDNIPERLEMAAAAGAETINFQTDHEDEDGNNANLFDQLKSMTDGHGPNACMDAVGMEAHGTEAGNIYDWVKTGLRMQSDRPNVFRQCIQACRKGGTVSVPGVYGGFGDKIPLGAMMNKALTIKTGQTHVQKYTKPLLDLIQSGKIDPSFVITHELPLDMAAEGYETFKQKQDGCIKVVLKPWEESTPGKVKQFQNELKPRTTDPGNALGPDNSQGAGNVAGINLAEARA
ncbi:MAG: glutathione-dependent formaldehyde dehydrogenase [Abitibacteriaceae bacterium]|nr:glutathione-dependent formaldehyde dehydrogenase [Abditibacteriaceae bacterium]